jgi:hypothetical protein
MSTPEWFVDNVPDAVTNSDMFKINIVLQTGKFTVELLQDIDIDYELLEEHLQQTPAQYMFWATVYSELRSSVTIQEKRISIRKSVLTSETLERYSARSIKLTDKQLYNVIGKDEKLDRLEAEMAVLQKNVGKLFHMIEAIKMKSEHCRSLAGFKRQDKTQSSFTE